MVINREKQWPLLLKNYVKMKYFRQYFSFISQEIFPFSRIIKCHIKNGIMNLNKPSFLNFQQIVIWMKNILDIHRLDCLLPLEPKINGCSFVFLENSANLSKIYTKKLMVSAFDFACRDRKIKKKLFQKISHGTFRGSLFFFKTKCKFKVNSVFFLSICDFKKNACILKILCDSGIPIKSLFNYFFTALILKYNIHEIRQISCYYLKETVNLITFHDILDSKWFYNSKKNDFYIKKTIMPLEILLVFYKRIVIRFSVINSMCYGAELTTSGIIRTEKNITKNKEIVLITLKGEAVGLGDVFFNSVFFDVKKNKKCCKIKNVIMKKNTYPKKWKIGNDSTKKMLSISCGFLFDKKYVYTLV